MRTICPYDGVSTTIYPCGPTLRPVCVSKIVTPRMPCLELLEIPWVKYAALVSERSSLTNNSEFSSPARRKEAVTAKYRDSVPSRLTFFCQYWRARCSANRISFDVG